MRLVHLGVALAAAAASAACLGPATAVDCDDGSVCAAPRVCAPAGGGCVDPAQLLACLDDAGAVRADGEACTLAVGDGQCRGGVCVIAGCGDGVVDAAEACDDGPAGAGVSGDGCRADCGKVEACGDGVVDAGEACDDGAAGLANPADGCDACRATAWAATALIGGGRLATATQLNRPRGLAVDGLGNLFIADTWNNRIQRVDAETGVVTTVAGIGVAGFSGDGGPATSAQLSSPRSVAVDGLGNLYVADTWNYRVRRVAADTGVIVTIAGTGTQGFAGEGTAATSALLDAPEAVAVDGLGNVYVADTGNHRVRRIDAATGTITTAAGTGVAGFAGEGTAATSAQLTSPAGLAIDPAGNVYVADMFNRRVRRIDVALRTITTVVGTGSFGFGGDGGAATSAQLKNPQGLALDRFGHLYLADTFNHRIRRVDAATGVITTVAGQGAMGAAATVPLFFPEGVAVDGDGQLYVANTDDHLVYRIAGDGTAVAPAAGTGISGSAGEGSAATIAQFRLPAGLAVGSDGAIYVADSERSVIRRVDPGTGAIHTVVGSGAFGSGGDGGAATLAQLARPEGLTLDAQGNLFVADPGNHRVRRVDAATGVISTIAGSGQVGFGGDGGPATSANLAYPQDVAVDPLGHVFISDQNNHRVRRVDAVTGLISTVAGTGTQAFDGDGGPATSADLRSPYSVALDAAGNLFIADYGNHRIRRVAAATGTITTVAGSAYPAFSGDGGPATSAQLFSPTYVRLDAAGSLYIADRSNRRVRRVDGATQVITTIAGDGAEGFAGDGLAATSATLRDPTSVAVGQDGAVYVGERIGAMVRRIDPTTGRIQVVAGQVDPDGAGPLAQAVLATPQALVVAAPFTLLAGGTSGTVQAVRASGTGLEVVAGRYRGHEAASADLARFRADAFGSVGGVAYDAATGRVYVSETSAHRLHVITTTGAGVDVDDAATWTIATLAGSDAPSGEAGFVDGLVAAARLRAPAGLHFDDATRVLTVADAGNHVVRAVDLSTSTGTLAGDLAAATIATVAGTPATLGFFGDGGAASAALLYAPQAVTRSAGGDLFIADTGNHRVRRVEAGTGVITTVLGDGVAASSGQGAPAWTFPVSAPRGLATDAHGNLYVTSSTTVRLVAADPAGVVDGSGAVQTVFGAAPRDAFPASVSTCLTGVAVVDAETVHVTDSCAGLLVELWRQPLGP